MASAWPRRSLKAPEVSFPAPRSTRIRGNEAREKDELLPTVTFRLIESVTPRYNNPPSSHTHTRTQRRKRALIWALTPDGCKPRAWTRAPVTPILPVQGPPLGLLSNRVTFNHRRPSGGAA